jgi:hypothetical protein
MDDQSTSARFPALFESALHAYEKKTTFKLAEHPLALQLQSCHSVDDISTFLQNQAQAVNDSQAIDRIIKSIKMTLSILIPLSDAISFAEDFSLVSQQPLMACFISPTVLSDHIIHACESNTGWSRCPTQCMCRSLVRI